MHSSQFSKHVVVETEDDFDRTLHEHAVEVPLADEDEEAAYERLDDGLAQQLQSLLIDLLGKSNDGILYHQILDWWPTRTRFLEIDSVCVTWGFIDRLQSLLVGHVEDWRINIRVYTPLHSDSSQPVGGLNVYREWILAQRAVYELLPRSSSVNFPPDSMLY